MGSCLKIPRRNRNASWKVPRSCYCFSYLFVTLLGVTCRIGVASGAQPTYNNNQSGAINKQSQQASPSSQGKERSEVTEGGSSGGPPPTRYSGNTSHRGYSSYNIPLPKALSAYTSSLHGHYPVSDRDAYYDDYYERPPGRQFSARSVSANYPMMAQMAATAANQVGFTDNDFAATGGGGGGGHGHSGGHGGGHGSGWGGWGWGSGSVSKVDNASLGLLGLLGLLSLLSNVLMLITTTAAAPAPARARGRRKREVQQKREVDPFAELQLNSETKVENICHKILPSLNVIGHIQNGKIPVNCSHQEVCTTNQILVKELGIQGRTVGSMLSNAIVKMMLELETPPNQTIGDSQSFPLDKYLLQASLDGRNGKDCETSYPTCEHLGNGKRHSLPQLVAPEQVTAIVFGKNPRLVPSTH